MPAAACRYGDLGKSAQDLLNRDYALGGVRLEAKSATHNGSFSLSGFRDAASGAISADLKQRIANFASTGVDVTTTIGSAGTLTAQLEWRDALVRGVKIDATGALLNNGKYSLKVGSELRHDNVVTCHSVDCLRGPTVASDIVVGALINLGGGVSTAADAKPVAATSLALAAGADVGYDVQAARVQRYSAAAALASGDYAVTVQAGGQRLQQLSVSYFHRVAADLEAAARCIWDRSASSTAAGASSSSTAGASAAAAGISIEAGARVNLDATSFVKTKVDSAGRVTVGYTQLLRPGFKVNVGAQVDTTRLAQDVHKIGVHLVLEA